MKKATLLNDAQIGQKIKGRKSFWVSTNGERKSALTAARFEAVSVFTRKSKGGGFTVYFENDFAIPEH